MKKRVVRLLIAISISVVMAGCKTITADTTEQTDRAMNMQQEVIDKYIDITSITSYSGTDEGLQLNLSDRTGYYIEVSQDTKNNMTQVFYVGSENDYNSLMDALVQRNGRVIIQISNGTVTDNEGNGVDSCGYYQHYDPRKFSKYDKVQSVFIYNPINNSLDDIVYRMDVQVE